MKKLLKYSLFILPLGLLASCEHPDMEEKLPGYYTQPVAYVESALASNSQTVGHAPSGLVGTENCKFPFVVKLNKPVNKPVSVTVGVNVVGAESNSEYTPLSEADLSLLSGSMNITIPAGEVEVADTLIVNDWSFAEDTRSDYTLKTRIVEASKGIYPAERTVDYTLTKKVKTLAYADDTAPGTVISDRSGWSCVYAATDTENPTTSRPTLIDGLTTSSTSVYGYGACLSAIVDFGKQISIKGFANYGYTMSSYSPVMVTLEVSNDKSSWKTLVEKMDLNPTTSAQRYQYVTMYDAEICQYVRVRLYGSATGYYMYTYELFFYQ